MRNLQDAMQGERENAAQESTRHGKVETRAAAVARHKDELLQVMAQAKK